MQTNIQKDCALVSDRTIIVASGQRYNKYGGEGGE